MKNLLGLALVVPLALAACSHATTASDSDPTMEEQRVAYDAIRNQDWTQAEAQLKAARAEAPNDPYLMLNLAYVLQKTDRTEEAARIYRQVLDMKQNPYAAMPEGNPKRVKRVAVDGLGELAQAE